MNRTPMVSTEILDHILGFLRSENDYTTLEICSAIFPQHVDRHLYSHITFNVKMYSPLTDPLEDGNYIADPTKFSLSLIDRPHIANCVRSVRIFVQKLVVLEWPEVTAISSNLLVLSQLKSIILDSRRPLQWTLLDPEFRTALQNSIRLPSITEVDISNINSFPLDVFEGCKNLEHLRLFGECTGGEAIESTVPHLRSFDIRSQNDLMMARIVSWIRSTTLHSLSIRMYGHMNLPRFQTLIEACSATVVNLELDHQSPADRRLYSESTATHPTFPRLEFPLLEQLILQPLIYIRYPGHYSSSLPFLKPFLSSIPSTHPIRLCVHLKIFIRLGIQLGGLDWSDIADFLVLLVSRHPVELRVHRIPESSPIGGFVSSFQQNSDVKRLVETGKLVIKESVL